MVSEHEVQGQLQQFLDLLQVSDDRWSLSNISGEKNGVGRYVQDRDFSGAFLYATV